MQTFLPYPDYKLSAKVLDMQRLGKQRSECLIMLQTILEKKVVGSEKGPIIEEYKPAGWRNHPCTIMWEPYPLALAKYTIDICDEWMSRGYHDIVAMKIRLLMPGFWGVILKPLWLGDPAFHASHRSNLLRKDPSWYGNFGWTEPNNLPYVWPT